MPVQANILGVDAVAAGQAHSLALKNDGTVWAWGYNSDGELGDGSSGSGTDSNVPVEVKDSSGTGSLQDVIGIAGGDFHSLALKSDGTVWAWGSNGNGQLGDGQTSSNSSVPVEVVDPSDPTKPLSGVVAIAAGGFHSLALKSDGTVWAWGANDSGQLGNGTFSSGGCRCKYTPVEVVDPSDVAKHLSGVSAIAAGGSHSLAIGKITKGSHHRIISAVMAWGRDSDGQLGDGKIQTDSDIPVQVKGLSGVSAIAGGVSHSLALRTDGTVRAWGSNFIGQLGNGTTTITGCGCRATPVKVSGLSGVSAIAGGGEHSLAN